MNKRHKLAGRKNRAYRRLSGSMEVGPQGDGVMPLKFINEQFRESGIIDREVKRLDEAVRAVHDVLSLAAGSRADVVCLCSALHYDLREKFWLKQTGKTFGEQLSDVCLAGGDVRLLLAASPDAVEPISKDVLALQDKLNFEMIATGDMPFFETFPHFTLARDSKGVRGVWAAYIEPHHREIRQAAMDPAMPVQSFCLVRSDSARLNGDWLWKQFDKLFERAKSGTVAADGGVLTYQPVSA